MPYAVPAPTPTPPSHPPSPSPSPSTSSLVAPPARSPHRRTRSAFTDERGPGAFVSLGALPRRRPSTKKALFHLNPDDSPPEDHHGPAAPFDLAAYPMLHSLQLAKDAGRFTPPVDPPAHIDLPPLSAPVPFPSSSPLASPTGPPPRFPTSPSSAASLPRVPSTPIILSNGKQLKPSLKSSSSSPNIADMLRIKHLRAQSAPSTPNIHKNVHFAEDRIATIRLFNRAGKPISVSKPPGDDTETETEADNSSAERAPRAFPFPSSSLGLSVPASSQNVVHEIDPSPLTTSPVPAPLPPPLANVHLETVTLPRTRPPTLRGTVIVRNVSYEKNVAVRFTLDDWQTTSEVVCKHVVSLPGLPPPFPRHQPRPQPDLASRIVSGRLPEEEPVPTWDRFSFTIRLEDYETKLADRTLWLVARFNCPGGEWWDNNQHQNYRVGFRRAPSASLSPLATPVPSEFAAKDSTDRDKGKTKATPLAFPSIPSHVLSPSSQQRTFSAPNTMRFTPMTGTLTGIPVVAPTTKATLAPPMLVRTMSSPYPPSSSQPMDLASPSTPTLTNPLQHTPRPASPTTRETAARTDSYIRRKLNLSNYVAPGHSPTQEKEGRVAVTDEGKNQDTRGLVTPPITPPGTVRVKGVGLPRRGSPPPALTVTVDDEPEGDDMGEIPSEPEDADDDTPRSEQPLHVDTSALPTAVLSPSGTPPKDSLLPFSPTSLNVTTRPFSPFNQGGYLSPPRSRDASEDGSGEGGRGSPATGTPPPEPAVDDQTFPMSSSSSKPMHVVLPALGLNFAHQRIPAGDQDDDDDDDDEAARREEEETPNGNGRVDTSDSSYAAFVRQWCFAQSTPPTPGVLARGSPSASPRHASASVSPASATPTGVGLEGGAVARRSPAAGAGPGPTAQQPWLGVDQAASGIEYGFPGFGFGGVARSDVGMVGARMG